MRILGLCVALCCHIVWAVAQPAQPSAPSFENLDSLAQWNTWKGNADSSLAIGTLQQVIHQAQQQQDPNSLRQAWHSLYLVYKGAGNMQQAYLTHQRLCSVEDSLTQLATQKRLSELTTQYQLEKKKNDIEAATQDGQIRQVELKNNKFLLFGAAISFILIAVIAGFIYQRYHFRQQTYVMLEKHNALVKKKHEQLSAVNKKLQQSKAELNELNATKDKFFSIISQDLRAPLKNLMGFLNILMENAETFTHEELRSLAMKIDNSVNNLTTLIENLLQWSRTQMGTIAFQPTLLSLAPLIKKLIGIYEVQALAKNLNISLQASEDDAVLADENMARFIFKNLLASAIASAPENSGITIALAVENNNTCMRAHITGNQLAAPDKLQDPSFWQGQQAPYKEKSIDIGTYEQGAGLGLILSREFIEKHHGHIQMLNHPGTGAAFSFTLPRP